MNYQHDDWLDLLSQAEFAYNNTTHASTGIIPFFANYGFHPRFNLEIPVVGLLKSCSLDYLLL
jgi:glycosylphosphatidylinositol phospholipase D